MRWRGKACGGDGDAECSRGAAAAGFLPLLCPGVGLSCAGGVELGGVCLQLTDGTESAGVWAGGGGRQGERVSERCGLRWLLMAWSCEHSGARRGGGLWATGAVTGVVGHGSDRLG